MSDLATAIELAVKAHSGQRDKAGQPYILHPLRVMFRCDGEVQKIVAVLHDVIEDTDVTADDLRKLGFSEEVLAGLDAVTARKDESYDEFVERAARNPIGRVVKLADLEDNLDVRRLGELGERDLKRLNKYLNARKLILK
ncbi:MAG: HD domain-containing protein [Phycisphaera sp.]|nr:HD domain-containing protein [Phycisphaera sp.]